MKITLIDNYDSFAYNLVHYLRQITGEKIDVYRNNQVTIEQLEKYDAIVLSPGPGIPDEAGLLKEIIKTYAPKKRLLGVCLGEQAIGEVFGAKLQNTKQVFHGVATKIYRTEVESDIFQGIPHEFEAGRYHSWIVDKEGLPSCLEITAEDSEGRIMALKHKTYDVQGVQFHPESILTPLGYKMIENWVKEDPAQTEIKFLRNKISELENRILNLETAFIN